MHRKIYGCLALAALIVPGVVQAKEDADNKRAVMEEVVVTATRHTEEISKVPAHVTVITADDIEKSPATSVPDLLRNQAGLHVNDITGNGRNFTVDIRGFGETAGLNTLALVNGVRINQADLSGTDWTLIPLDRIQRIEIIRGGRGAILYGDNASGGAINIITKEGDKPEAEAKIMAGSYDTFKSAAVISGSRGDLTYALSGGYVDSDGYRDNSGTEAKDVGINLGYLFNESVKANFSSGYHKDSTALPGALKLSDLARGIARTESLHPGDFADVEDSYVKAGPEIYFLNNSLFKMDASVRKRNSLSFASFDAGTFAGDTEIKTIALSPRLILEEKLLGFVNNLVLGFDYSDISEDIKNDSVFFGFPSSAAFNLAKKNQGYYLHEEFGVTDKLAISGGYRHDHAKFEFSPSTPQQTEMDVNLFTAGINYGFRHNSSAYLSFTRSFRYPVFDEMFSFFTNTLDTNLQPQTSRGYELGVKHAFSETLSADVNFFRIDTDDELFFNPARFANENLDGKTRRDGVEISIRRTWERISLGGSYTYTEATIKAGQFAGKDIPDVPEHKATIFTQFTSQAGLSLSLYGIYVGERPFISDFANAHKDQEDYLVVNAKLAYPWKLFTFFADFNNITNQDYSEYGGLVFTGEEGFFPSPRFNFLLGVRAHY